MAIERKEEKEKKKGRERKERKERKRKKGKEREDSNCYEWVFIIPKTQSMILFWPSVICVACDLCPSQIFTPMQTFDTLDTFPTKCFRESEAESKATNDSSQIIPAITFQINFSFEFFFEWIPNVRKFSKILKFTLLKIMLKREREGKRREKERNNQER